MKHRRWNAYCKNVNKLSKNVNKVQTQILEQTAKILTNLQRDVDILSTSPMHQTFSLMYQIADLPLDEIQLLKPLIISEPRM